MSQSPLCFTVVSALLLVGAPLALPYLWRRLWVEMSDRSRRRNRWLTFFFLTFPIYLTAAVLAAVPYCYAHWTALQKSIGILSSLVWVAVTLIAGITYARHKRQPA